MADETDRMDTPPTPGPDKTGNHGGDASDDGTFSERPEIYVGAALVGGFALAKILKRLGR
jgi:hypothetical protein